MWYVIKAFRHVFSGLERNTIGIVVFPKKCGISILYNRRESKRIAAAFAPDRVCLGVSNTRANSPYLTFYNQLTFSFM